MEVNNPGNAFGPTQRRSSVLADAGHMQLPPINANSPRGANQSTLSPGRSQEGSRKLTPT
jgi:hypothetical protein